MKIGVISDTHGLIRPEALDALRGVDAIVHAGVITHILPRPRHPRDAVCRALRTTPGIVIFGHSHLEVIDGIRFFNPASAGPRRFDDPVAVGIIDGDRLTHVPLDRRSATALRKRMNQLSGR